MLDCLEGKPLRAVCSVTTFIPDVRWIIGSQEPLAALVLAGKLRRDLAARLGFAEHTLAPLRERLTDVVQLAPHLLAKLAAMERLAPLGIGCCAMKALLEFDWPDNVRQLETALHYALVVASAEGAREILRGHLPDVVRGACGNGADREPLDEAGLRTLLEAHNWNVTEVARMAKVNRRTAQRKMTEYGIRREA